MRRIMKTKLIQIEDYLLLINEEAEIKEGDIVYRDTGVVFKITNERISYYREVIPKTVHKIYKCLAYYPLTEEAKELDLPLLPNPFNKQIDEVTHLKNLGHECFIQMKKLNPSGGMKEFIRIAVEFGYKAAQSKQLELLKRAIQLASDAENIEEVTEEIIQSLSIQQLPKEFISDYEIGVYPSTGKQAKRLKTITNSEGKEELVGTYK